jgi:hypothetical protein
MALTLRKEDTAGYKARSKVFEGGGRLLDAGLGIVRQVDGEGNLLSTLWDWGKKALGFAWSVVVAIAGGLAWSFSALWGQIVSLTRFLYTFDFGASDASLDANLKAQWDAFAGRLGGAAGAAAGWLACGVLPGAAIFVFNPVAGAAALDAVVDEAGDELVAVLRNLATTAMQGLLRSWFTSGYKALRKWLQKPGNPIYPLLPESLREAWKKGKSWSIAQRVEARIEALPGALGQFVEEFVEEFFDSCTEAGFVIAGALDGVAAQRRLALGQEVILEVIPDRSQPTEKFILAGPQELVKAQLTEEIQQRRYLSGKDMGVMVDDLPREIILAASPFELYGWAIFEAEDGQSPGRRPRYQLPALKRSVLDDYDKIRVAFGGANGYLWGRWVATASNTTGHPLIVRGASAQEAEERLRALAELCELKILTVNITEEKKSDQRLITTGLQRDGKRVKPHSLVIINRKYFTAPVVGSAPSKQGNWLEKKWSFDLRSEQKPSDWNTRLAEVLRGPVGAP